jgi:CRISPR-associated endonuclease Csn1
VYASDAIPNAPLPNRAAKAHTREDQWPEIDESFHFRFSLYPNDWVWIKLKNGIKEGYYCEMDRGSGASLSIYTHDRNQSVGEKGKIRGIGISTALAIEKYHVDLLGGLHRVHHEERQPIHRKHGR